MFYGILNVTNILRSLLGSKMFGEIERSVFLLVCIFGLLRKCTRFEILEAVSTDIAGF